MSEVFYRKWRPRLLSQVAGQDAVTQTLRNAVVQDRVAHAYLLCGPRGTGKTSTARILAKAINCRSPLQGEPDGECDICQAIDEGRALDLIEIDAASNRGIDDIRSLREKVHFAPNEARYKVYIVDEVHMLTEPAFNALLKTLEEPPAHAIFVLATTEVHKVPLTIISRCQRFDFRRIPMDTIVARLAKLCTAESVEASEEALTLIARAATGSLRDAENILEQALVSYGSPLHEDAVSDLLDLGNDQRALELVGHIVDKATQEGLTVINQVAADGVDLRQFHRATTEYLRGVLLLKSGVATALGYPDESKAEMQKMAGRASLEHLLSALKTFVGATVGRDSSSPLALELAMVESAIGQAVSPSVDALEPSPAPQPRPPQRRQDAARERPPPAASHEPARAPRPAPQPRPPQRRQDAAREGPPPTASHEPARAPRAAPTPRAETDRPRSQAPRGDRDRDVPAAAPAGPLDAVWSNVLRSLARQKGRRFNLGALLRSSTAREIEDGTIVVRYAHSSHRERIEEELDDPQTRRLVEDAFTQALGESYKIRVSEAEASDGGARQSPVQSSHLVRAAVAMGAQVAGDKEDQSE